MYERERLKAVEELLTDLLRVDPALVDAALERADEMINFGPGLDDPMTEDARTFRYHLLGVRVAKRQLLRRAKHPEGEPIADDDDFNDHPDGEAIDVVAGAASDGNPWPGCQ